MSIPESPAQALEIPSPPTPLKIILYTAIPATAEAAFEPPSWKAQTRKKLDGILADLRWRFQRRFVYRFDHSAPGFNSNAGDVAIREATRHDLERVLAPAPVAVQEIAWGKLTPADIQAANDGAAAIVISSGAYIHLDVEGRIGRRLIEDMELFRQLQIPLIAYGTAFSYRLSAKQPERQFAPESLPVVREFLNQLAVCGVRDDVSAGLIRSACGEGYPVAIVPDPALFFVDSVSGPPADVDKKQSHSGIRIGVNFAFHGPHSQGLTRARFLTYCDALKSVAAATQCQFVYFAHTAGERLLAQKLRESGLSAELAYGGPEELVRRYPTVDLHLGQMLHSCILAASTYTPIVNLVYDSKNLPFMQSLGLQDYCIFPDQVSTAVILKKITHALAEQVEIRQQLRRRVGELKHDRDRFLAGLAEVVRNSQTARTS